MGGTGGKRQIASPRLPKAGETLGRAGDLVPATPDRGAMRTGAMWDDIRESGPSAVAAAQAREPWRPSVDEYDLLPDAQTGWRR